jgi:hypothetical protein
MGRGNETATIPNTNARSYGSPAARDPSTLCIRSLGDHEITRSPDHHNRSWCRSKREIPSLLGDEPASSRL